MNKKISIIILSAFLVLTACSKEKEVAKTSGENQTAQTETNKETASNADSDSKAGAKSEAEEASELVLKSTRVVKIFSLNQRIHENYKELGPFYVVRGVDDKGRKTEVWVHKGKIYEIK